MNPQKDTYDFDYEAPYRQPGFITFKTEKGAFFRFLDEEGKDVLFSQKYASTKSRDNGMESVKINSGNADRYRRVEENGKFYFILKAANHQEIARSRKYSNELEMEAALILFKNYCDKGAFEHKENPIPKLSTNISTKTKSPKKPPKKTVPSKVMVPTKEFSNTKAAFRLELYHNDENSPISGIITNLHTDKKQNFKGLDETTIIDFIKSNLPKTMKNHSSIKESLEWKKRHAYSQKEPMSKVIFSEDLKEVNVFPEGSDSPSRSVSRKNSFFDVKIDLSEMDYALGELCKAQVYAKSLSDGKVILLGNYEKTIGENGLLNLRVSGSVLKPGIYRLTSIVHFADNEATPEHEIQAGSLMQVF